MKIFDNLSALLGTNPEHVKSAALTPEQWYEVRAALKANIQRERDALPFVAQFPMMHGEGGVLDRAYHSIAVQESILPLIP
ncbi:hypothetical protein RBA41_31110 [Massilia sp. CCM 9210]|uniref:hypothetical protein n=1 Tax=Massilia scottii TaxID=3057166 RepID=UPI00279653A3|nr:hypothetical protein [Massilia sp. CCM 9210]MDQ1817759.1 hypothetical protein [Massilia sp. CCM 9210]